MELIMNARFKLLVVAAAALASSAAMAEFSFPLTTTVGVAPVEIDPWTTGDAGQECVLHLGYDFGLKIDNWSSGNKSASGACDGQGSCTLAPEFDNTINVTNNDGVFFDWVASSFPLGAVVVKGGPNANVFAYDSPASADSDLYAPLNPNTVAPSDTFDISHASFCWNKDEAGLCYQEETAWGVGRRYVKKGNWAMYVPYESGETVQIRAAGGNGVGMDAGTMTFSAPAGGYVQITIKLTTNFIFYYDLNNGLEDDNLKVQDYKKAPTTNPAPGRFAWKSMVPVGATEASISVPKNKFYGVHLDLAYQVPCK
jgi:hypothetical protein